MNDQAIPHGAQKVADALRKQRPQAFVLVVSTYREGKTSARLGPFLNHPTRTGGQRETLFARTGPHRTFPEPSLGLRDTRLTSLNYSPTPARKTAPGPPRLSPPPRSPSQTRPYRKRHSRPPEKAGTPNWEISTTTCRTRVSIGCGIRGLLFRIVLCFCCIYVPAPKERRLFALGGESGGPKEAIFAGAARRGQVS